MIWTLKMLKYWCKMRHSVGQTGHLKGARAHCAAMLYLKTYWVQPIVPSFSNMTHWLSWTLLSHDYGGQAKLSEQWPRVKCVRHCSCCELHCCAQSACASLLPEEERSLARPWAAVAPRSFAFAPLLLLLHWSVWYHGANPNLVKHLPRIPDIVKSCIVVKSRV